MEEDKWGKIKSIKGQYINRWQLLPSLESICLFQSFYAHSRDYLLTRNSAPRIGLFCCSLSERLQGFEIFLYWQRRFMRETVRMKTGISRLKEINSALPGLMLGIVLFGVLCQTVGFFLVRDKADYSIGLWIGILTAIFMAFHMAFSLNLTVERDEKGAQASAIRQNIIRYVVVVIIFGILMLTGVGNPLAAFLGVMGLKFSAYIQPMLSRKMPNENVPKEYTSDEVPDGKTE